MSKTRDLWIKCPECDYGTVHTYDLRRHYAVRHPNAHPYDLELHIVTTANPELDIGLLLVRYLDQKETVIGLQKQGIFVKTFLRNIGVARSDKGDKSLMARTKRAQMGPGLELRASIKRTLTKLKQAGVEADLEEVVTALRLVQHTKRLLERANEPEKPKEPEDPRLIGRFTVLDDSLEPSEV